MPAFDNKRRVAEPFYSTLFGRFGYVPRKKLPAEATKIVPEINEITLF